MKIAIHQKSFLPWQGYFAKMLESDIFIESDDFQFSPNEMYHRTFKNNGEDYLTIPIIKQKDVSIGSINLRFEDLLKFRDSFKNYLISYKKHPELKHWKRVFDLFEEALNRTTEVPNLSGLIDLYNKPVQDYLGLTNRIQTCDFDSNLHKTEQLLAMLKQKSASGIYISGGGGRSYLDTVFLNDNGFATNFQSISNPHIWRGTIVHLLFIQDKEDILKTLKENFTYE